MKITQDDFAELPGANQVQLDSDLESLSQFYRMLSRMVEERLHDETFNEVLEYVSAFGEHQVAYITPAEEEKQLRFCAKWRFTFTQLRDELKLYHDRADRAFQIWWAHKAEEARTTLLKVHKTELDQGHRTKGKFGVISRDEVKDYILHHYSKDWLRWQEYLERIRQGACMMDNLTEDIKQRSIILMNLGNRNLSM